MANEKVREYSLEEVKVNNGKNGKPLWLVIKDQVYDVTEFIEKDQHPGGPDLLADVGGKDATKDYNDAGHSNDADKILKKHKIGILIEDDRKTKSKKPKEAKEETEGRSLASIITCGLCG